MSQVVRATKDNEVGGLTILKAKWKAKLNESHAEGMQLIMISFLCVQLLSAARDPVIATSALPIWLISVSCIFIVLNAGLLFWVRSKNFPAALSHLVAAAGLIMSGLKPIAYMLAEQDPGPLYLAVVMLAGSLCFLSLRYLVYCSAILMATWFTAATQVLPMTTVLPAFGIIMLGAILSVYALNRRIRAAMLIFALEQRVDTLEAILPMCASCKKTRDHTGEWKSVEEYIEEQKAGTQVSHGSCPSCTEEMYGDVLAKRKAGEAV